MRLAIAATFPLAISVMAASVLAAPASAASGPFVNHLPGLTPRQPMSATQLIEVVDPATINCSQVTTFDDIPGGAAPGTNYDGVLVSIGVAFAERFDGQTLSYSVDHDVLSGSPNNPLVLVPGAAGQNLNVIEYIGTNVMDGLGPLGYPDFNAIGEGSFAVLFSQGQSEISFKLIGGDGGSATLDFYRQDGSLIDTIVLTGLAEIAYGFRRVGGIQDIAGVSVWNEDGGGIGIDDVCHDVVVVPTKAGTWGQVKNSYR